METHKVKDIDKHGHPFQTWLRKVCFQKPTPEAHDLARAAWLECEQQLSTLREENEIMRNWRSEFCPNCLGTGAVADKAVFIDGSIEYTPELCISCGGRGTIKPPADHKGN